MIVKKCELNDLNRVAEFYDKVTLHLVNNVNYPKWTYGVYPCKDSVKQAILAGEQFVVLKEERVLGAFIFNFNPQGAYQKANWQKPLENGEYMVIHTLATDPTAYGKGIASKMVNFCFDYAKLQGLKGIRLDVVPTNTPARKLYEKLGFNLVGEFDLERGFEDIPTFVLYEYYF